MKADERRNAILSQLRLSASPTSAETLANKFGVSRQVVVGDVALLRAFGNEISATPRGYVLERDTGMLTRTLACCHSGEDMERELNIMVDNGCIVKNVTVDHPIYGQLTGSLELKSRYDVKQFVARNLQCEAQPLSALTDGIHLHTLLCPDEEALQRVIAELKEAGILLNKEDA